MSAYFNNKIGGGFAEANPTSSSEALNEANRVDGSPYRKYTLNTRDLDMSLPIELGELSRGKTWPPERLQPRLQRSLMLRGVYEGDYCEVMDLRELIDVGLTPVNYARRIIAVQANLMMTVPPEGGGERLPMAAHRALHDLGIHGSAFVEKIGDTWRCVDARRVYWTDDGDWVTVEPRLTGGSKRNVNQADTLMVTRFQADGMVTRWYHEIAPWDYGSTTGRMLITGGRTKTENLGSGCMAAAYRQPEIEQGGWGQSLILDLITLFSQLTVARARDTEVIDKHSRPILILRGSIQPYKGSAAGAASLAARQAGRGKMPSEILEDQQLLSKLMRNGILNFPDGSQYAEYITWTGDLNASMQLQERIDMDMRLMSGVTAILGDNVELPSGMSLKRMFSVADAEAQSMRMPLLAALQECDGSVTWENAFEQTDDLNVEDVENEATARRGEATPDDRNEGA